LYIEGERPPFRLMYCYRRNSSGGALQPREYRLSWYTAYFNNKFMVDAETGEIILNILFYIDDQIDG
jgi:hypothetical protein